MRHIKAAARWTLAVAEIRFGAKDEFISRIDECDLHMMVTMQCLKTCNVQMGLNEGWKIN